LITHSIQPPYAVSIDGLWGTGKTTVMKMLQKKLEEEKYPVFWFNPWEYRQTESVVLAFLQCLADEYNTILTEMKASGSKMLRVLLQCGMDVGLKMVTRNNLSLKDVTGSFETVEKKKLPSYKKYKNTIETIKKEFLDLINRISKKNDNKPVIIFFDDLDRCLPDDSIQLLEALKNLFVTKNCNSIFICGIDTRIAKQFISAHYSDIEEMFAINYFRKIFNLTISMPYGSDIYGMLYKYILEQYQWREGIPNKPKSDALAKMVADGGLQAEIFSIRKYLNVIDNFNVFLKFNPSYNFDPEGDFVVYLLLLKEAWQHVYEKLIQIALRNHKYKMRQLIDVIEENKGKSKLSAMRSFFDLYFKNENKFANKCLYELLTKHPTLALRD